MRLLLLIGRLDQLSFSEKLFWSVAIVSTLLVVILLFMSFFGFELDGENDRKRRPFLPDTRSILLFFTFFGWTALLADLYTQDIRKVLLYSLPVGVLVAFLPVLIQRSKRRGEQLRKSSVDLQEALSSTGEVMQYIPPHRHGVGKVNLNLRRVPVQISAISQGNELEVGAPVRVIEVIDDNILVVEPLDGRLHAKQPMRPEDSRRVPPNRRR